MSVSNVPKRSPGSSGNTAPTSRGLTLRSFFICIFALLLMGAWIEIEECFFNGGPLAENSPPNSAIGVILLVMLISIGLYALRRQLRVSAAELVFVYAALLIAAPLMTQGMWHRIFAVTAAIPNNQDWKSLESLPSNLWPHGKNLITNGRFEKKLVGFQHEGNAVRWADVEWRKKPWSSPVLSNDGTDTATTALSYSIPCKRDGKEIIIPGERFIFTCLVKAQGMQSTSSFFVRMRSDNKQWLPVNLESGDTKPTFALPGGFKRIGLSPIQIPPSTRERIELKIGITGPGKLTIQDMSFMNFEGVSAVFSGVKVVTQKNYNKLGPQERDSTYIKPDNMFSIAGLRFLLTGFIPWDQWLKPMFAWFILIGALFIGFLGFNVLMRKQWVDNERFTFPMNIIPRNLFGGEIDEATGKKLTIFTNRIMWIGFAVTLPLLILKGLHYYYPEVPAPYWQDIWSSPMTKYVNSPTLKAFFSTSFINLVFVLFAVALLVETDILFTIWVSFLLFNVYYLFGKIFGFNRFVGYPWDNQQSVGSFIAYAFIAVVAARRHLANVFKHIVGIKKMDDSKEIVSYRMAFFLIIAALAILGLWGKWTNMGVAASILFFGYILVCGFAAGKIRAECGAPYGYWMPYYSMIFVGALGGFAIFGSTGMLLASIASGFMMTSCFLFLPPVQVEMMELGRHFNVRPRDIAHGLTMGLIAGVFLGGFVLLAWAYGFGSQNLKYSWPYDQNWYFDSSGYRSGENMIDYAFENDQLIRPINAPLNIVKSPVNIDAKGMTIGIVITAVLAILRSMFTWFPLHPVGYVLAATFFSKTMWFTCFLAWLVRLVVLRIGGAHTIRRGLVPFCIGIFLACIFSIVLFDGISLYLISQGVTKVYTQWP